MKINFLSILSVVGCLAFVSCYPIVPDRAPGNPNTANPALSLADESQQTIEEKRRLLKEREEARLGRIEQDRSNQIETTTRKPDEKKSTDYAFATAVPGKAGFVFSPYNNKLVDVRDIPSGTLVQDPTYPQAEKKYFRVP